MKIFTTSLCCILLLTCSTIKKYSSIQDDLRGVLPMVNKGETVVYHNAYALVYNERHEQASWVGYLLTKERANGQFPRNGQFRKDPAIGSGSANEWDYKNSGYTRGHLAPAGDMKWDQIAMEESFLMSNMSPQSKEFNDGVWNRLENQVRLWARQYDSLYVFTGPVLADDETLTIGQSTRITVPRAFYKVIYAPKLKQGIGFIVPHETSKAALQTFAINIDGVEEATGIDFLHGIANEENIEGNLCIGCWTFGKNKTY
ncbi:MAG: DNA/RNA non-specific endonuclease [Bacteroidales bacterium]|nr:DNA/RNA non-specific endonuclease [Bacteroidales bacterium]